MAFIERLLPGMRSRGFGRVVAIGSMAVREPIEYLQLSNAHRPGLVAAFKVLARQSAGDGVTFNHVHPGAIATDRILANAPSREAADADARKRIPAQRLGDGRGGRLGRRSSSARSRPPTSPARRSSSTAASPRACRSTPKGNRTPANAVKGRRANRYTMGAGRETVYVDPSCLRANIRS